MLNVNIINKQAAKDLDIADTCDSSSDKAILSIIEELNCNSIIEYPCNTGAFYGKLSDDKKAKYKGYDFRRRLVEVAKNKFNDNLRPNAPIREVNAQKFVFDNVNKPEPIETDVLICRNYLQMSDNPKEFVRKIVSHFNAKSIYITFPYSKKGIGLSDSPKLKRLPCGNQVIDWQLSEMAVKEIADEFGMEFVLVNAKDGSYAALSKEGSSEAKPVEVKKEEVEVEKKEPKKAKPKAEAKPKARASSKRGRPSKKK